MEDWLIGLIIFVVSGIVFLVSVKMLSRALKRGKRDESK